MPEAWVAHAIAYAVVGGVGFGGACAAAVWLLNGLGSDFEGLGSLVLLTLFGAGIGLQVGLLLGLLFVALAALVRPRTPSSRWSMIWIGACTGAIAMPMGLFVGPFAVLVIALIGGAYGGFVGAQVADLRRS